MTRSVWMCGLVPVVLAVTGGRWQQEGAASRPMAANQGAASQPAVNGPSGESARPRSPAMEKGIAWLLKMQHENGGFSQGEESSHMGSGNAQLRDQPNVGDTCMAALALIRDGSTPSSGPHAVAIRKALDFVFEQVAAADQDSLWVTNVRGTRLQGKIGQYIDTFLAAMLLAETKGKMPDAAGEKRLVAALDKVMDKIERNQQKDGSWKGQGWAPILSQSMAGKALNRAAQVGYEAKIEVLDRADDFAREQLKGGGPASAPSSAGVALYAAAGNIGVLSESLSQLRAKAPALRELAANGKDEKARDEAKKQLGRLAEAEKDWNEAQTQVSAQMTDARFISGFGSNGGEEFLSYMNLSESLRLKGGDEWSKWNDRISANMEKVQNQDGSWQGHHCITGRTFCTATALLVLMADRAPLGGAKVATGAK